MKHRIGFNRLDRSAAHRKALHRSMVTSLIKHERITTTKAKALEIRRTAEKMITRAKVDSVHNRRLVSARLYDEAMVAKLFNDIALRMKDRPGGYTRVLKLGERDGDGAEMVILEFVDYKLDVEAKEAKKEAKAKKAEKAEKGEKTEKAEKPAAKKTAEKKGASEKKAADKKPAAEKKPAAKKAAKADDKKEEAGEKPASPKKKAAPKKAADAE